MLRVKPNSQYSIPIKSFFKRSLLIFITIAIALTVILFFGIRFDEKLQIDSIKSQEVNRIKLVKERVTRELSVVDTDLRVLVNLPLFQEYLDSESMVLKTKLEHFFLNFSRETQRYEQIRYLDVSGQEILRVNYNEGYPSIVSHDRLQNKKGRDYFTDTIKLNKNEIFVSSLDLNIENGKLEIPFKPVIRYGTPVFDNAGHKKGMILLNYLGSKLLDIFQKGERINNPTMLLNRNGYWLAGAKQADEWGFMLGNENRTFGYDYPDVWATISTSEQGSLLTDQGLFVFTTAYHLSNWQGSALNASILHNHYWKVVSFIPHTDLSPNAIYNQPLGKVLLGIVYFLLMLSSFYVAQVTLNRRQVEIKLRDSATRVLEILNAVGEGIYGIDRNDKIFLGNPAATRMLGWKDEEIVGQSVNKVMYNNRKNNSSYSLDKCPIYATLNDETPRHVEDELFWCKDGTHIPVSYTATVLRSSKGDVIGVIVSFRDITEQKKANKLLLDAKEKAEMANRAKDSFLATMSHEIRTPLTGMLGMLEVLSMAELEPDQVETLQAAWDSARNLLRIVNDILDWSKIEEGKLAIAPRSTSISQLLQEVVNTYSSVASAKSLIIRPYTDERLSSAHIVDPLRLSQILNNFVSNAIKFTHEGEIELSAELIEQHESGERIRFSVKDTGVGIPKSAQKHLFHRYRQANSDTARMYGGTGLGLSISKRLAQMLDGEITLESELGHGSTFSLMMILPVSGAPAEQVASLHPEVSKRTVVPLFGDNVSSPLVLAVDDHPINRDLLARQIKLLGLRAETAEDGGVALSMWQEGRFDLVITDCHMPEMDGYTFSQEVRRIEIAKKLPRTPIIAWTANALAEEVNHCQAAGMDELLLKPANLEQLKQILIKWLPNTDINNRQAFLTPHDSTSGKMLELIDYTVLAQIEPDHAKQMQILRDFMSHMHLDYAKLLKMLEQEDQDNIENTAHRMKGSSLMMGAGDLANACAVIEQAAKNGDMVGAITARKSLDTAIQVFEEYLIGVKN